MDSLGRAVKPTFAAQSPNSSRRLRFRLVLLSNPREIAGSSWGALITDHVLVGRPSAMNAYAACVRKKTPMWHTLRAHAERLANA